MSLKPRERNSHIATAMARCFTLVYVFFRFVLSNSLAHTDVSDTNGTQSAWKPTNITEVAVRLYCLGYLKSEDANQFISQHIPVQLWNRSSDSGRTTSSSPARVPFGHDHALREFQREHSLPVSGQLDMATTRKLLSMNCRHPHKRPNTTDSSRTSNSNQTVLDNSNSSKPVVKWYRSNLTWRIKRYPRKSVPRRLVDAIVADALHVWSSVTDLNFTEEKGKCKVADIEIVFGVDCHNDTYPFDGSGLVLGHAFFPDRMGYHRRSGDVHFDDDEEWDTDEDHLGQLSNVILHEIGHCLGLSHTNSSDSVMYAWSSGPTPPMELSAEDIANIQKLYGTPSSDKKPARMPRRHQIMTDRYIMKNYYCKSDVDAIIPFREREMVIFKGEYYWRIRTIIRNTNQIQYLVYTKPDKIRRFWFVFPENLTHIDAGVETKSSGLYLFSGSNFWLTDWRVQAVTNITQSGNPLSDLGFTNQITKIDSAFRWNRDDTIYLFSGDHCWRLIEDGQFGRVADMTRISDKWPRAPSKIDEVLSDLKGNTWFISGNQQYVYDYTARIARRSPALEMFGCTATS